MLGTIIYVAVLLVNAIAILNEERFLSKIGWTASRPQTANAGFQTYDQTGYGSGVPQGDVGMKAKGVELVTAVRTLLRIPLIAVNIAIIVYELLLGG
ncbi:Yos1-like protein [Marasmius fiardii PR-910]|nr:Yos1-like protein [Marasmius fiardii PR-910]